MEIFLIVQIFFPNSITPLQAIAIDGMVVLTSAVIFFFPYSLGIREGAYYHILDVLVHSPGLGLIIAILNRTFQALWILIGFAFVWKKIDWIKQKTAYTNY